MPRLAIGLMVACAWPPVGLALLLFAIRAERGPEVLASFGFLMLLTMSLALTEEA